MFHNVSVEIQCEQHDVNECIICTDFVQLSMNNTLIIITHPWMFLEVLECTYLNVFYYTKNYKGAY